MDFICITKLKSRNLISVKHGPVKVSYTTRKAYQLLTRNQVEKADKAITKVLEWKIVQRVLRSFFLKMEHQHKYINCKKTKYLEKLREVSKSNLATRIRLMCIHILKSHMI